MTIRSLRRPTACRAAAVAAAFLICAALILTPSLAGASTSPPDDPIGGEPAIVGADSADAVPGEYIVVLKPQAEIGASEDVAASLTDEIGGEVTDTFDAALEGYTALLSEDEALEVAADQRVEYVEQSQAVEVLDEAPLVGARLDQTPPPSWGEDRIDQRALPLDTSFSYPDSAGEGVHVYIVDSGIRASHQEFAGRLRPGYDGVTRGGDASDCFGHGTHVAGTAAGSTFGVAKQAIVHPVRVLDCSGNGSTANIIRAVDWLTEHAVRPAIANYSIGCRTRCESPSTDRAVRKLVASGVTWVQSAGNENDDSCHYSPQVVPEAITVGASTRSDDKAETSNHGRCVDLFAPGASITSSWFTDDTATRTISGTSMASPHVAGAAALYLGEHPDAAPAEVQAAIVDNATPDALSGLDSATANRLLYTGFLTPAPTPVVSVDLAQIDDQKSTVGTAASVGATATGGTAPYTFAATGLPKGMQIDTETGVISGTPASVGTANVSVSVRDDGPGATTDTVTFSWSVSPAAITCPGTPLSSGVLERDAKANSPRFTRTAAGPIEVCLDGPDDSDFDVYLQKRVASSKWKTVAEGATPDGDESFSHAATAGTYRLVVKAYEGSGAYTVTVR